MNASALVSRIDQDFPVTEVLTDAFLRNTAVFVDRYWSGEAAPVGRHFEINLGWSDLNLYVRFDAQQAESLVVSDNPDLTQKTIGLWNRDVCELFVAPDADNNQQYFEFEVAPTGEWLDAAIEVIGSERMTDFDYSSGLDASARIETARVVMAMKIPWEAFAKKPKSGDLWHANFFRCLGDGPSRGYLAWSPTRTENPNFHVPEAFGELRFS